MDTVWHHFNDGCPCGCPIQQVLEFVGEAAPDNLVFLVGECNSTKKVFKTNGIRAWSEDNQINPNAIRVKVAGA